MSISLLIVSPILINTLMIENTQINTSTSIDNKLKLNSDTVLSSTEIHFKKNINFQGELNKINPASIKTSEDLELYWVVNLDSIRNKVEGATYSFTNIISDENKGEIKCQIWTSAAKIDGMISEHIFNKELLIPGFAKKNATDNSLVNKIFFIIILVILFTFILFLFITLSSKLISIFKR